MTNNDKRRTTTNDKPQTKTNDEQWQTTNNHKPQTMTNDKQWPMRNNDQWQTTNSDKWQTMTNGKQRTMTNDKQQKTTNNDKEQRQTWTTMTNYTTLRILTDQWLIKKINAEFVLFTLSCSIYNFLHTKKSYHGNIFSLDACSIVQAPGNQKVMQCFLCIVCLLFWRYIELRRFFDDWCYIYLRWSYLITLPCWE